MGEIIGSVIEEIRAKMVPKIPPWLMGNQDSKALAIIKTNNKVPIHDMAIAIATFIIKPPILAGQSGFTNHT